ncbi:DUF1214 domain-containing protein [Sinorhizobium medicae]|nr:DUF1214 domain-containing protein [Sinorhizobium medicae]RVJ63778.1 DUF1214 domain-containing protein [Sinorhizobium medicae]RVJ77107.1 DUF1214 domain-containing protein [Sinorhizobium medicae]
MYNASDKMLVENLIQHYKVGTDTQGLKKGPDGWLTIAIQNAQPSDENLKLAARPERRFLPVPAPVSAERRDFERDLTVAAGHPGIVANCTLYATPHGGGRKMHLNRKVASTTA